MKHFVVFLFILLFLPLSIKAKESLLEGAKLRKEKDVLILHLKGGPFKRGYQQGYLLKEYIRDLYHDYFLGELLKSASSSKIKRFLLLQYFKFKAKQLEKYIPQEYREEMKGIARGSILSYNKILLMHTFLDTMPLLKKIHKTCTNFVLLPSLTQESLLLHARNLGFSPRKNLFKNRVIFFVEPDKGFPFVAIGWPGMCGVLSAMNTNELSVGETGVGTADLSKKGIPIMFLLRKIVQYSPDIWSALREISKAKRMCGYTITLSDGKTNQALVAEITAKKYEIHFPEKGYLVAVNHYLSKRLFATMKPVYPGVNLRETSSYKRLVQFKKFVEENKKIDIKSALGLLKTPPIGKEGETLQSILFIPEDLKFYFLLPQKTLFFDLKEEFKKSFPKKILPSPDQFIKENQRKISPHLLREEKKNGYKKLTFLYRSKTAFNELTYRKIFLYLYLPANVEKPPCLFFLPHSAGVSRLIEGNLAEFLAKKGMAFLTMEIDMKNFGIPKKRINTVETANLYIGLIKELILEAKNVLVWLKEQPFIDKEEIAVGGLSLGAVISATLLGTDDEIECGVFLLGGADFKNLLLKSRLFKKYRKKLTLQELDKLLDRISFLDPLNFSYRAKQKDILMINALFDKDMPAYCVQALWRALEYPDILWLPEGHFTAYLSFGYVENKILEFLEFELKGKKIVQKIKELKISAPTGEKAYIKYEHKKTKIIFGGKYSSYERRLKVGLEKKEILNSVFWAGLSFKEKWEEDTRYNLKGNFMYELYLGTQFTQNSKIYLGFSGNKYSIYDLEKNAPSEIKRYYGRPKVNFLTLKFLKDTTDHKIYPTKGNYLKLRLDMSLSEMGSDFNFYRFTLDDRHYYNFKKDKVFVFRTKWGYLDSFADTDEVPFFEKFYLGGSSTIRGYRGRRVGVLDENLLPLGGNFFGVFNLEFRFPIYKFIYGATFFDSGFLGKKISNFSWDKVKCGSGVGLRFRTKWGFIKLDYGFKIGADKETERSHLHVSFGLPF
jgi:hypothetical protein